MKSRKVTIGSEFDLVDSVDLNRQRHRAKSYRKV